MRGSLVLACLFVFFSSTVVAADENEKAFLAAYRFADSVRLSIVKCDIAKRLKIEEQLLSEANRIGKVERAGELLLLLAKDRVDLYGTMSDSLEAEMLKMIATSAKKKLLFLRADLVHGLGELYWNDQKHIKALDCYLASYKQYHDFSEILFPRKQHHMFQFGGAYYDFGDFPNALKFLQAARMVKPDVQEDLSLSINNSIGTCYRNLRKYDSAEIYFRNVLSIAYTKNDSNWISIASGNIGILFYIEKRYEEAIPLLETDIRLSTSCSMFKNAVGSMCFLGDIYLQQNRLVASSKLFGNALHQCYLHSFWNSWAMREMIFRRLSKQYAAENNMLLAYRYADSAFNAKDSLNEQYSNLNLARFKEKLVSAESELVNDRLLHQRKEAAWMRDVLITGMVLLVTIALLFISRQKFKQKSLEAEKRQAEAELAAAVANLDNFRLTITEKNTLIAQYSDEIAKIATNQQAAAESELITQLERSTILTDQQWDDFKELFEKVYKGFFVNLKKTFPQLTPAEVRFFALAKLKLSSKEMAAMLGVSTNAIRIYRHRLRKKLSLDKDEMIEALVDSF